MLTRFLVTEYKWIILAFFISFVLISNIASVVPNDPNLEVQNTFFGLNLFLEILVFFVFNAFVVFGIKGFFENYSQKTANIIIFSSGIILVVVLFILTYQVIR